MNYTIREIAQVLHASDKYVFSNQNVTSVYIDTRQISVSESALFVAISTHKSDGHKYIPDAYKKGIRNFLVQYLNEDILYDDANYIVVNDTVQALQNLAAHHRTKFHIPIIGITGSNGKTIVKEWLYFLLKDEYFICRSPRSFNSQIGVPLSVLNLNASHTLGIFEAGISLPREMQVLEGIIVPDIAVLTHFGAAHSEGFESDEQKLNEKLKLFRRAKSGIVQRFHNSFLQTIKFDKHIHCISENQQDAFWVQSVETKDAFTHICIKFKNESYTFSIPFKDEASIKNAVTCFATIYLLNKKLLPKILKKFQELPVISLRLEIKKARFQSVLISDYYNSDIDSFEIAISYFQQYTYQKNKILILSDYDEVKNTDEIYNKTKQIINQSNITKVFLIGNEWQNHLTAWKVPYTHYLNTLDFLENFSSHTNDFFNAVILLKAARKFEFERIAHLLELKTHDTVLEINIPALYHNLNYYKNLAGKNVRLMCMLKASGYGSGSVEMAYALQKFGVDYIAVAYADEGVELREAQVQVPIMVMLPEKNAFKDIVQYQLEPEIYSFDVLHAFVEELERQGIQSYPIHLKIDTGMHRLGFLPDEVEQLIVEVKKYSAVKIKSVFSHLAASESDEHKEYTLKQIQLFKAITTQIENAVQYKFIKHICNSAAVSRFPEAHLDMVRLGIGMYGISDNANEERYLQNVLSLKTKIAQIKHLKKGDSVGYSRSSVLDRDSIIAIIPIGYADGFSRSLGKGNFFVQHKNGLIPTIGNVCMDMTMLDITDVKDVQTGDEIIVFSNSNQIKKMAMSMNTIPYEVLTSISQRVNRVYVYE